MKESKSLKCKVRGCKKPYSSEKHKLCPAHRMRLLRIGQIGDAKIRDYEFKSKDKI